MSLELRPAVFVDRDGTILQERDYLASPDDVELVPGTIEALARLHRSGFLVVVVTNQSGIARGLYTEGDYRAVASRLDEILAEAGVMPDRTEYCPHHPDFTGPCECRKPAPGMHRRAAQALAIDLRRSFFVGDKLSDVAVADAVGGRGVLVLTGYGREHRSSVGPDVRIEPDFPSAARWIASSVDPDLGLG